MSKLQPVELAVNAADLTALVSVTTLEEGPIEASYSTTKDMAQFIGLQLEIPRGSKRTAEFPSPWCGRGGEEGLPWSFCCGELRVYSMT